MLTDKNENWLYTISPKQKLFDLNLKEIWYYRDLLILFVKRNVITVYKQTILGPLWYFIQPLFTSIIFTLIFNNMANIPTGEGVPPFLFNLAGITCWNYFKECLTGTSNTFGQNQGLFGKVYFPRVIVPLSVVCTNLVKYAIQILVFVGFYFYYAFFAEDKMTAHIQSAIVFLPVLIIVMGLLGLGLGMIISSMTTKYRDLKFLIGFGVQLLMYGSAVMYPLSYFKQKLPEISWVVEYNPMTTIIEAFRFMTLGAGDYSLTKMLYTVFIAVIICLFGLIIFNKTEKSFIDTI
ncbi:ABC transporter permease [Algibacter sp.]|uniref:ABC transporter permease n=1 Tax=Algibacter sp. TaxID=1872428 RepID=UPI003C75441D